MNATSSDPGEPTVPIALVPPLPGAAVPACGAVPSSGAFPSSDVGALLDVSALPEVGAVPGAGAGPDAGVVPSRGAPLTPVDLQVRAAEHARAVTRRDGAISGLLRRRAAPQACARALVAEQTVTPIRRHPEGPPTYTELLVLQTARLAAQRPIDRATWWLRWLARRSEFLAAVERFAEDAATAGPVRRVRDPRGGSLTVEALQREHDELHQAVVAATSGGTAVHRRLPRLLRRIPAVIVVADLVVLLFFTAGVFNVDPAAPVSLAGCMAALFALIGTGVAYGWLTLVGHRLKALRDGAGEIRLLGAGRATRVLLAISAVLILTLGFLMYTRVHQEVADALGPGGLGTAAAMGLVFAVLGMVANAFVIAVHALDGSVATERLDELAAVISRPARRTQRWRRLSSFAGHRRELLSRRAQRRASVAVTSALTRRAGYERAISAARAIHQGCGPFSAEPGPFAIEPRAGSGRRDGYRALGRPLAVDDGALHLALLHGQSEPDRQAEDGPSIADAG